MKAELFTVTSRASHWFASLHGKAKLAIVFIAAVSLLGLAGMATAHFGSASTLVAKNATEVAVKPQLTHKTLNVSEQIPYTSSVVDDPNMAKGTREVRTSGVEGIRVRIFDVTYDNGREISREFVSEFIVQEPINEVIAQGVRQKTEPWEFYDWNKPKCEKVRGRYVCLEY